MNVNDMSSVEYWQSRGPVAFAVLFLGSISVGMFFGRASAGFAVLCGGLVIDYWVGSLIRSSDSAHRGADHP